MSEKKAVRIKLFKDNSRYKEDLFVSVNGVNYKIRRGVEVEVPPEVAEVLEHSQMQDERTLPASRQPKTRPSDLRKQRPGREHRPAGLFFKNERSFAMTVEQALARARELRPGCKILDETCRRWLCEEDALLRQQLFEKSGADEYAAAGADLAWSGERCPTTRCCWCRCL